MNSIDSKILEFIEILKRVGEIRFDTDFVRRIGMSKQHLQMIKSDETRHFTAEHIKSICDEFGLNANWLFNNEKELFIKDKMNALVESAF